MRGSIRDRAGAEGAVLAAALCVAWAGTFIAQRYALADLPPAWMAALRLVVAALVLLPFASGLLRFGRRELRWLLVLGLLNQVGFVGLQIAGLDTIGAGPTAAIIYVQPILVTLAAAPVLDERLTRRRLAAVALGFAGVAIGQHLVAVPVMLAIALLFEHLPSPSGQAVSGVIFAGVAGSALGWLMLGRLLERGEAGAVTTRLFTVPILAAVLAVLLLGEPVTLALVAGIALVGVAVRLTV